MPTRESKARKWLALGTTFLAAIAGAAVAQQAGMEPPDYAAVLGSPQTVRDVGTGKVRGLTQRDIDRQLRAEGVYRTAKQRQDSRAVNAMIQAMPTTREEAARQAPKGPDGTVVILTSREELQPMYGVVGTDGGMRAAHDPSTAGDSK